MKKLFLQSGKLCVGEFPADVIPEPMHAGGKLAARSQREVDDYNAAVSAAKASAVEVVDFKDSDIFFEEGKLYDIREGWTVEIEHQHKAMDVWETVDEKCYNQFCIIRAGVNRKIARLIPQQNSDEILARGIHSRDNEIEQLQEENAQLKTTMIAAAEEIQEHWEAHCDEDGYGPANLMHRLEKGVSSGYPGYNAGQFTKMEEENQRLKQALVNLYKEIRSRFAKNDDLAFESMSVDLAKPMLEARKLLEP